MRVETHFGNNIVCGHIYPFAEIKVGSRWQSSGGRMVTVVKVDNNDVYYEWKCPVTGAVESHDKDYFSFQCRYCLILE